ncbi:Hypothetical predicted protein [Olea europaea subsp. europaea]|uniref:Uncharacterized protein n=2 Tax=Olea europaea subsp. europaea TaxID=158383 RepID=A0A8S0UBX7_OLEEU|nr:Hypothetical predicted protein [Olea europaea subsp. europaea]
MEKDESWAQSIMKSIVFALMGGAILWTVEISHGKKLDGVELASHVIIDALLIASAMLLLLMSVVYSINAHLILEEERMLLLYNLICLFR